MAGMYIIPEQAMLAAPLYSSYMLPTKAYASENTVGDYEAAKVVAEAGEKQSQR